jgi:peroxiredoxin
MLTVGQSLPALRGLAAAKGGWVLVTTYPKDPTPCCPPEKAALRDKLRYLSALGLAIVGIGPEGTAAFTKYAQEYGVIASMVDDPEFVQLSQLEVVGDKQWRGKSYRAVTPATYVVDPAGVVKAVFATADLTHEALRIGSAVVRLQHVGEATESAAG